MSNFEKRFKQRQEKFDKDFERAEKLFWVTFFIVLIASLSFLLFIVWAIISLMQYFGVI